MTFGTAGMPLVAGTVYLAPGSIDQPTTGSPTPIAVKMPLSGTITSFAVMQNTPGVGGSTITYTVLLNGAPTAAALTILPSTFLPAVIAGSTSIPFSDGQEVSVRAVIASDMTTAPMNVTANIGFRSP
jgi:hypothetical protein